MFSLQNLRIVHFIEYIYKIVTNKSFILYLKQMRAIIYLTVIGIFSVRETFGIIGYDCGTTNLNVTTVSLIGVDECNIPLIEPHVQEETIQLLQLAKFESINVIQCKVVISRNIYYCGMHSHVSTVHNAQAEYIVDTSLDQCKDMHRTGRYVISVNNFVSGLKVNQTTVRPTTFAGSVTSDGKCSGAQYSDPYGTWQNVIVQGTVRMSLSSHQAITNTETNQLHLKSGSVCKYSDGNCVDIEGRDTYWDTIPIDYCKFNHYDVLYEGKANKMASDVDERQQVIYSLSTQDVTFALTKSGEESLCGYTLIKTEHPKLVIVEKKGGEFFAHKRRILTENLDIFAYVNSKFVFVERHIRTQMNHLYRDVIKQRCSLERQVMSNALTLAVHSPDEFAYQIMKKPGHMAVISAEVAHIIKCTPVEVKIRHTEECYQQLAVSKGNETYFLAPRTHILMKTGTQVTCSRIIPAMYLLKDGWYRITPTLEFGKPPITLQPMTQPTWNYTDPGALAASGIYTNTDLEKLRDHIMFPAEKIGILNTMARGVKGEPTLTQGISLSHLLDENAIQKITESAWKKIWGTFLVLGNASAGVIGIYFSVRAIKLIIDTAIHGYALHTIYGWSLHLIGALWDSVTNLLLHLGNGANKKKETQEDTENQRLTTHEENSKTQTTHTQHLQPSICSVSIENENTKDLAIRNETHGLYPRL